VKKESVEIDATVAGGSSLLIPREVLNRLNVGDGDKVHIRVTTSILSGHLRRRNVTEEEIERIVALQLEPRENVIKFLATESKFSRNARFKRRALELRGRS
jgi:antitoxin component of MazEF toxin-antitoxin module